jgi:hypothetical protein
MLNGGEFEKQDINNLRVFKYDFDQWRRSDEPVI